MSLFRKTRTSPLAARAPRLQLVMKPGIDFVVQQHNWPAAHGGARQAVPRIIGRAVVYDDDLSFNRGRESLSKGAQARSANSDPVVRGDDDRHAWLVRRILSFAPFDPIQRVRSATLARRTAAGPWQGQ